MERPMPADGDAAGTNPSGPGAPDGGGLAARAWRRFAGLPAGRRLKWLVLLAWIAIAVGAGPLSGKLTSIENNSGSAYLPRNAESTQVTDALNDNQSLSNTSATVVYASGSTLDEAQMDAIARQAQRLAGLSGGQQPVAPVPAQDGRAAEVTVPIPPGQDPTKVVPRIREIVKEGLPSGVEAKVTGPAAQLTDFASAFSSVNTTVLLATVIVVTLVLLLTYRSPFLWLVPLAVVGLGYTLAAAVVYLASDRAGLLVSGQTGGILPVLVFGAGTDYALLLIARYREQLHVHADRHRAMAEAMASAGPAIIASAATVTIGLLCLLAAEMNTNRGLGPIGAMGIVCAFLAMTTLMPALLVILGRWVFWPFVPRPGKSLDQERTVWARIGRVLDRRARIVWPVTAVALLALGAGVTQMKFGLGQVDLFHPAPEAVQGQKLLTQHFPAGLSDPGIVVASSSAQQEVAAAVGGTSGVATVLPPVPIGGGGVLIPFVLADTPVSAPAERTVERVRDAVHAVPGAAARVGGDTATDLDTRNASLHDARLVIPLVLAAVFVVLTILLRALVASVLLIATVVLSFLAALGGSTLAFTYGFGFAGTDYSVPLLGFVFLVALGVDYNIFLMTRVREEVPRLGHRPGVLRALAATGGVITSAGVVLAATFSVLAVLPLVSLAEIGFVVAFGVLLDTFVVRPILVPALILHVGRLTWWPSRIASRAVATPESRRGEPSVAARASE